MKFIDLENKLICADFETTSLNPRTNEIFGIAISYMENGKLRSVYYDTREDKGSIEWLIGQLRKVRLWVNHNIKFDMLSLLKYGYEPDFKKVDCTLIRAGLIDEHLRAYDLDSLGKKYLKTGKRNKNLYDILAEEFGGKATKEVQMPNLHLADRSLVAEYAIGDSELAYSLYVKQQQLIERMSETDCKYRLSSNIKDVLELERNVFPCIFDMEMRGIRIDVEKAELAYKELSNKVLDLSNEINEMVGFDLNINSPNQVRKAFNPIQKDDEEWYLGDFKLRKTDAGNPSFDSESLGEINTELSIKILDCRSFTKLAETFIKIYLLERHENGRIYPSINQTKSSIYGSVEGTGTGRLSYVRPALQNIPSRNEELCKIIKSLFLPDDGFLWSYGDLEQFEFRVFCYYVNDPKMIEAYIEDPYMDFHQFVADLTKLPRKASKSGEPNAKQLNLAMVFNMGNGSIAGKMGLPYKMASFEDRQTKKLVVYKKAGEEAIEVIEKYHETIPGVKKMAELASKRAIKRGYVVSMFGRHLRFPDKKFSYKASGIIYQATSADLNKINMTKIYDLLKNYKSRLALNIHDEYSIFVHPDEADFILDKIKEVIQDHPYMRVPVIVDFSKPCENWYSATKAETVTDKRSK